MGPVDAHDVLVARPRSPGESRALGCAPDVPKRAPMRGPLAHRVIITTVVTATVAVAEESGQVDGRRL